MQIIVAKQKLLQGITLLSQILEKNQFNEKHSAINFIAKGGTLELSATTDLVRGFYRIPGVEQEFSFSLKGETLMPILRSFNGEDVKFSIADKKVSFVEGKSRYTLSKLGTVYQVLDTLYSQETSNVQWTSAPSATMLEFLKYAKSFCIDKETPIFALNSAQITGDNGRLSMMTINSQRAIKLGFDNVISTDRKIDFLMPRNCFGVVAKLCEDCDAVEMAYTNNMIAFRTGSSFVSFNAIAGKMPDVISKLDSFVSEYTNIVALEPNEAVPVLSRIANLIGTKVGPVSIFFKKDVAEISASDSFRGVEEFFEQFPVKSNFEGKVILNISDFASFLQAMKNETFLYIGPQKKPIIITDKKNIEGMIIRLG